MDNSEFIQVLPAYIGCKAKCRFMGGNGGKHCSDAMTRMVRQGFVIRVKKGVFALNKNYRGNKPVHEANPNQKKLF